MDIHRPHHSTTKQQYHQQTFKQRATLGQVVIHPPMLSMNLINNHHCNKISTTVLFFGCMSPASTFWHEKLVRPIKNVEKWPILNYNIKLSHWNIHTHVLSESISSSVSSSLAAFFCASSSCLCRFSFSSFLPAYVGNILNMIQTYFKDKNKQKWNISCLTFFSLGLFFSSRGWLMVSDKNTSAMTLGSTQAWYVSS